MATVDVDLALNLRKKYTPPPSALQTRRIHEASAKERTHRASPVFERSARPNRYRQATAPTASFQVSSHDFNDGSLSSYGWQRYSDKISQLAPAPDIVYRNTYLDGSKREKSATLTNDSRSRLSSPRSSSPQSQQSQQRLQPFPRLSTASSSSMRTVDSSQRKYDHQQYNTVYDYIRDSIRQIERQRNLRQQYFSTRIKRPQNDDNVLRRALREKKNSASTSAKTNGNGSVKTANDLRNPESFINYIKYTREQLRLLQSAAPQSIYEQKMTNRYKRQQQQQAQLVQNETNSREPTQTMVMRMSAAVGSA